MRRRYRGYIIDDSSLLILQTLRDKGGSALASDLQVAVGLDNREQVHYRFREHLIPAWLVVKGETEEQPGAARPAQRYEITEDGFAYLDKQQEDLTNVVDAAKAVERLRETRRTVDRFSGELTDIDARLQGWQNTMDRRSKKLHQFRSEVKDDIEDFSWWTNIVKQQANQASDDIDSFRGELTKEQSRIDDLENDIESLSSRMVELEQHIEQVTQYQQREIKRVESELSRDIYALKDEMNAHIENNESVWDRFKK